MQHLPAVPNPFQRTMIPVLILPAAHQQHTAITDKCIRQFTDSKLNPMVLLCRPRRRWDHHNLVFPRLDLLQKPLSFRRDKRNLPAMIDLDTAFVRSKLMFV